MTLHQFAFGGIILWSVFIRSPIAAADESTNKLMNVTIATNVLNSLERKILSERPPWTITEKHVDLEHKNFHLDAKSRDEAIGISLEIIEPAELVVHEFRRTREFLPRTQTVYRLGDEALAVDEGGISDD